MRLISWIGIITSATVALVVLAILTISELAAHRLTRPRRFAISEDKTPRALGVDYEVIRLRAHGDRVEIAGWFIPSGDGRRAVVLVHGKDANRTREFDRDFTDEIPGEFPDLAVGLSRKGFAVLMIDLRGHGESGPSRLGFGEKERLDIRGALAWLEGRGFRRGRIGVLGVSMGAAASIGAAVDDIRIAALVADSSFAELSPLVEMHWWAETRLPSLLLTTTRWIGKHQYGCDIDVARPVDAIGAIRRPILLIHGVGDTITPIDHARRLKQAAGDSAESWEIETERHAGGYFIDPEEYLRKVAEFFNRHLT